MPRGTDYQLAIRIAGSVDPSVQASAQKASGLISSIVSANLITDGIRKAGAAIKDFATGAVQEAIDFESTMADVAKVVDGLRDANGNLTQSYYDMGDSLIAMSQKIPMTTTQLGEIMAAAGQSGIAAQDLSRFTETAAKMGIAFDTTAQQAGEWMATWRTALGLTQTEVEALGDQINFLGNTTSESTLKLSDVVTRVGSLGKSAGLTGGQLAALAASMPGVPAEIAATGIKNLMLSMVAGSSATKTQQTVLKKLGFTATGMAKRMQKDATGAIMDLLGAINKLPEAERAATLGQYFGKESITAIAPLMTNLGYLEEQFKKVSDAQQFGGSMEAEYAARADTLANAIQLLDNKTSALKLKIGGALAPTIGDIVDKFSEWMDKIIPMAKQIKPFIDEVTAAAEWLSDLSARAQEVQNFIQENKTAFEVAAIAVAGLSAAMVLNKASTIAATVVSAAQTAQIWLYCAATDAAAFATKIFGATVSFLTSPVTLVVGAIAALIAAGAYLYNNWDTLSAKGTALANAISAKFPWMAAIVQGAAKTVGDICRGLRDTFGGIVTFIKGVFAGNWSQAWQGVVDAFGGIFGTIIGVAKAPFNAVISLINTAIGKINSAVGSVQIPDWIPGLGGKSFDLNIPQIPLLAEGGIVTQPTLAMVGEGGESEAVIPLSKLPEFTDGDSIGRLTDTIRGGGDRAPVINFSPKINVTGTASKSEVKQAVDESFEQFKQFMAQYEHERRRRSFT